MWYADFDAQGHLLQIFHPATAPPQKTACLCCGKLAFKLKWKSPQDSFTIPASVCLFASDGEAWVFIHENKK